MEPENFIHDKTLVLPKGKKETFGKIREIKSFNDAFNALRQATLYSYLILGSIFSSIFAPSNFNILANKVYNKFKQKWKYILIYSILIVLESILFSIFKKEIGFISSIPSLVLSIMGLLIILLKDINQVLRIAQKVDAVIIFGSIWYVAFILYEPLLGIIQLPVFIGYYLSFFLFSDWRNIKREIDWYLWKKL